MTKAQFKIWTKENMIYLDGATGSNLIKAGMPSGVCPEKWILEHPEVFIELQKSYVEVGSNIVYAPTFSANRVKFAEYGLEEKMQEMTKELVALSRQAVGDKALIAGDITMTGRQLKPMGDLEMEELIGIYKEQIQALVSAGVDLLVVETMMSLQETRAAVIAAKETCELPVLATLTFQPEGRTLFGTDAVTAAVVLESLGVDAVGANCSTGPDKMAEIIRSMAEVTDIPVIAKPNAGLPVLDDMGNTCYDMSVEDFVTGMKLLVEAGASMLGGCCGTSPQYIRAIRQNLGEKRPVCPHKGSKKAGMRFLTSERQTLSFGLDGGFMVVGERINPTGKKKLQAALKEGSLDMVLQFAEEQEARGAKVLDVNMGMSGIDEKAMMLKALEEISGVSSLPLAIDSSHVEVLEAALRHYPGRALINSISYEKEKFEKLLPIAKKYGAMFILLPLSDTGLPADLEEKKEIINQIYDRAMELGFTKEDMIVDGLVNTVGANKQAGLQALETIEYCKERGLATICGLSNISFGMPERSFVNTAFLTMAIAKGLTMAIANPSQELLMGCAYASDVLLAKPEADIRYIEVATRIKEEREAAETDRANMQAVSGNMQLQNMQAAEKSCGNFVSNVASNATTNANENPIENKLTGEALTLYEAVLKGNRNKAMQAVRETLDEEARKMDENTFKTGENIQKIGEETQSVGNYAEELLNDVLMPAMNRVGELFEKGKYFLPQLIASAEAMKAAIEVLEPHLATAESGKEMPVIVIATVEGDIHDIGKNLVSLMLKNCGFQVVDLGKDVSGEVIVEQAREKQAKIIALSALMTTTMVQMKKVVNLVKEAKLSAKVMIGGAVITPEYAEEIGADGFSKDAAEAVKVAKKLCGIE